MNLSIRSDVIPWDPDLVPEAALAINTDQYFQFAVVAVMLYDALITMDREVKYFWGKPARTVNVVYFLNRYTGLLGAIFFLLCLFAQWSRNLANYITIVSVDYILMIRVTALYVHNRLLPVVLQVLLLSEAIIKFVAFIVVTIRDDVKIAELAPGVTACFSNGIASMKWAVMDWVVPMSYGLILMALAIYKAAEYWRISAGLKGFPLVRVIAEDQVVYFSLVAFCCAMNLAEFKIEVSNDFLAGVFEAMGNPSFLCMLGSRMLFNLKEAGEMGLNQGTSYRTRTMTELEFA